MPSIDVSDLRKQQSALKKLHKSVAKITVKSKANFDALAELAEENVSKKCANAIKSLAKAVDDKKEDKIYKYTTSVLADIEKKSEKIDAKINKLLTAAKPKATKPRKAASRKPASRRASFAPVAYRLFGGDEHEDYDSDSASNLEF